MLEKNLGKNDEFFLKVIQLFDTVQVRHGIMMVGGTMSGKTCAIQTLSRAITLINEDIYINKKKKNLALKR